MAAHFHIVAKQAMWTYHHESCLTQVNIVYVYIKDKQRQQSYAVSSTAFGH